MSTTDAQRRTLDTLAGDEGHTIAGGMDAMHPRAIVALIHGAGAWIAVMPDGDYYPLNIGGRRTPPVGRELGPYPAGQGVAA